MIEKTYKFKLPKNMEVVDTEISVKDGEIIVNAKLNKKIEFKDGDFVVSGYEDKSGSCYWISIIKNYTREAYIKTNDYVSYITQTTGNQDKYIHKLEFNSISNAAEMIRYATEQEKQELFEVLKDNGVIWNPKTKTFDPYNWTPKLGEYFYYVTKTGQVRGLFYTGNTLDAYLIEQNNYFKTKALARICAEHYLELLKTINHG